MKSFIHSLVLVLLARCASASTAPNLESRFGVSFSASKIIVSRFNSSGSIELTTFPVSSEYQKYYHDALQKVDASEHSDDIDEPKVKSIFRNSIRPITESFRQRLGHNPEYASLFLPSIFNIPTTIAAREVIFENTTYTTKSGGHRVAACWPYDFLKGKNVGRPAHECNDDGPKNLIFVLEYEEEYMYAWLFFVEYELGVYQTWHTGFCKDCGEKHRQATGEKAYKERVKGFVHEFISTHIPQERREEIRAIIVTGEASTTATTELGDIALEAVGTDVVRLMTDIDPSEVVAHGAAVWARMMQQQPEDFMTHDGNRLPSDEEWVEILEKKRLGDLAEHNEL